MSDHWRRRSLRLRGYDYSSDGAYFVTIVTQHRHCLFGQIVEDEMILNEAGQMVHDEWLLLPERFSSVETDQFVVMPNHLHGILVLGENVDSVGAPLVGALPRADIGDTGNIPTLGAVVGAFKSLTTVLYSEGVKESNWPHFDQRLWQRNYYEHIVRDEIAIERIRDYILGNRANWERDPENPSLARGDRRGRPQGAPLQEPWTV